MGKNKCCIICCAYTIITIVLLLLTFLAIIVVVPLVIKSSPDVQLSFIFPEGYRSSEDADYNDFKKYNIEGSRKLRIVVTKDSQVSLGVWHILPEPLVESSLISSFDFGVSLAAGEFPVVLYFHGVHGTRADFVGTYKVLRRFFHVITFDYRGYGDSTKAELSEEAIVQDSIQIFKLLRAQTKADIFFWGHSLGAALCVHTAAKLRQENIIPNGLFLEAPFTTMRDHIQNNAFYKCFSWLPWYESTMLNPLSKNNFIFNTTRHIEAVDCPIMIIHAEDDEVTPYSFGEELFKVAQEKRRSTQGSVAFYLLSKKLRCGHFSIHTAPELPHLIWQHILTCRQYNGRVG